MIKKAVLSIEGSEDIQIVSTIVGTSILLNISQTGRFGSIYSVKTPPMGGPATIRRLLGIESIPLEVAVDRIRRVVGPSPLLLTLAVPSLETPGPAAVALLESIQAELRTLLNA
ncbi:hypothetical protein J8273_5717 [Carpediemonas membranifera]|uniref:Uncharacterized protein n=1 Tax=Carpediemonas membranifera TaxID=201153 RepID=A0A8J6E972_9EUKA|nr:hypothetical protein J8273_5717 [Carpediemonas membranifera]|eukprot:KAG9392905.1 hypothetical protein J8273_5717 [Carpediemonas membranifera]